MTNKLRFLTVAAALLLIAGLALASRLFLRAQPARVEPQPAGVGMPISSTPPAVAAEDPAPPEVLAQKNELRAEYAKQKEKMPEDVAKPIEEDIGVIEGAAADLLAAIADEPDNQNLKRMLIETYRNEMKLLKKALHLSSADDDESIEDSAASTQ